MHAFYSPQLTISCQEVQLPASESRHALQVLRLGAGDHILLLNGHGIHAEAVLDVVDNRRHSTTTCRILQAVAAPKPQPHITLFIAPPKSKNIDAVIRTATELGAATIVPVLCRFGVAKPDLDTIANWTKTVIAAAKQSHNPWFPEIKAPVTFADALKDAGAHGFFGAVPKPTDADSPAALPVDDQQQTSLWIGPEGGFAPEELSALEAKGLQPLTVGQWILRVETAVPALLAVVLDRCQHPRHKTAGISSV